MDGWSEEGKPVKEVPYLLLIVATKSQGNFPTFLMFKCQEIFQEILESKISCEIFQILYFRQIYFN